MVVGVRLGCLARASFSEACCYPPACPPTHPAPAHVLCILMLCMRVSIFRFIYYSECLCVLTFCVCSLLWETRLRRRRVWLGAWKYFEYANEVVDLERATPQVPLPGRIKLFALGQKIHSFQQQQQIQGVASLLMAPTACVYICKA